MPKFKAKPKVIEAIQNSGGNGDELVAWANDPGVTLKPPPDRRMKSGHHSVVLIKTLEGTTECAQGWWLIKGLNGEFYPCRDDIFQKTYEAIVE